MLTLFVVHQRPIYIASFGSSEEAGGRRALTCAYTRCMEPLEVRYTGDAETGAPELNEIAARSCLFHLERLGDHEWYFTVATPDGRLVQGQVHGDVDLLKDPYEGEWLDDELLPGTEDSRPGVWDDDESEHK